MSFKLDVSNNIAHIFFTHENSVQNTMLVWNGVWNVFKEQEIMFS